MYQTKITDKDSGQRFDKYLHRILPKAASGFIYKMLRKKNITLNDKKADGSERIVEGDSVTIYFSDETLAKFMGRRLSGDSRQQSSEGIKSIDSKHKAGKKEHIQDFETENVKDYMAAYDTLKGIRIIYENNHILLVDKPAGILSQKAERTDISLTEWLIGYLLESGAVTEEELAVYKPSVCNRLDRNTSGIVLCAKSLKGAQLLSGLLKNRTLHKYYRLYVKGIVEDEELIEGYLIKDEELNKVTIEPLNTIESVKTNNLVDSANLQGMTPPKAHKDSKQMKSLEDIKRSYIKTGYRPIQAEQDKTLLEVELFTGKTHQIRAHLASIGHPLLGDPKYGDAAWNEEYRKKHHVRSQLLHAYKVVFPQLDAPFEDISGRTFIAELPEIFSRVSDHT